MRYRLVFSRFLSPSTELWKCIEQKEERVKELNPWIKGILGKLTVRPIEKLPDFYGTLVFVTITEGSFATSRLWFLPRTSLHPRNF